MRSFIFNSTHYYTVSARHYLRASVWVNGRYLLNRLTIFIMSITLRMLEKLECHNALQLGKGLSFKGLRLLNKLWEGEES